jgi:tocopherol cyclase
LQKFHILGNTFTGFIAGLYITGKSYNFSTYTNAKLEKLTVSGRKIFIVISNNRFKIEIETSQNRGKDLIFTVSKGGMAGKVEESLSGIVSIKLIELKSGDLIFSDVDRNSGVEIQGNIE